MNPNVTQGLTKSMLNQALQMYQQQEARKSAVKAPHKDKIKKARRAKNKIAKASRRKNR